VTKRRGRPKGTTARKPARKMTKKQTTIAAGDVSVETLLSMKKVAEEVGSVEEAKAALNALEKLLR